MIGSRNKQTMRTLNQIDQTLKFMGFDREANTRAGFRVALHFVATLTMLVDQILLLVFRWHEFSVRMETLKCVLFFALFSLYSFCYYLSWDDLLLTLSVMEKDAGHDSLRFKEKEELETKIDSGLKRMNTVVRNSIRTYSGFVNGFALVKMAAIALRSAAYGDLLVDVDNLPLPYRMYYPPGFSTVWTYIFYFVLQLTFAFFGISYQFMTTVIPMDSMHVVATEIESLAATVSEIDRRLSTRSEYDNSELKYYIKYLIESHQAIYRKCKYVDKGCQSLMFFYQCLIAFILCLTLYMITQTNGIRDNTPELFLLSVAILALFLFNHSAEEILKQEENLRNTLYGCDWIEKPTWYKKDLLIMMIRCNRLIEMKPFGLFVMNLRNFSLTMNAAYSYFNLLNNS